MLRDPAFSLYRVGHPEPSWRHNHENILKHTVLRRRCFIAGSLSDGTEDVAVDWTGHPDLEALLAVVNGPWASDCLQFYTAGRDVDEAKARELVFATCLQAGLLLGGGRQMPSIDDWGQAGESAGRIALGYMVCNVLFQVWYTTSVCVS